MPCIFCYEMRNYLFEHYYNNGINGDVFLFEVRKNDKKEIVLG